MNYVNKQPYPTASTPIWDEHKQYRQTPPPKPKAITIADVFPRLDHWAIGFDDMFDTFRRTAANTNTSSYPPYNLIRLGYDFELQVAVAGFKKENLKVTLQERSLTIASETTEPEGKITHSESINKHGELLHQGIAKRDFTLNFVLAENVEVVNATLKDGMLVVNLRLIVPEEKKPKVIDIK